MCTLGREGFFLLKDSPLLYVPLDWNIKVYFMYIGLYLAHKYYQKTIIRLPFQASFI